MQYLNGFASKDGFVGLSVDDIADRVLEVLGYATFDLVPDHFHAHATDFVRARGTCAALGLGFDATVYGLQSPGGVNLPPQQEQQAGPPPQPPPQMQPPPQQQPPPQFAEQFVRPPQQQQQHAGPPPASGLGVPPGTPIAQLTAADLLAIATTVVHAQGQSSPQQPRSGAHHRSDDQAIASYISQQIRGTGVKQNPIQLFKHEIDKLTEATAYLWANADNLRDLEAAISLTIWEGIEGSAIGLSRPYSSEGVRAYVENVFRPGIAKMKGDLQTITDSVADHGVFRRRWCVACMELFAENNIDETKSKTITILLSMVNSAYSKTMTQFKIEFRPAGRAPQTRSPLVPTPMHGQPYASPLQQPASMYAPATGVPQPAPPGVAGPPFGMPPAFPAMPFQLGPVPGLYPPPPGPPPPPPLLRPPSVHSVAYGEVFQSGPFAGLRNAGRAPACHGCGWLTPAISTPPHTARECAANEDKPGWSTKQQRLDWLQNRVARV